MEDYLKVDEVIEFDVGQDKYPLKITIVDDKMDPIKEGKESFNLKLFDAMNAVIVMPEEAKVIVDDKENDGMYRSMAGLVSRMRRKL